MYLGEALSLGGIFDNSVDCVLGAFQEFKLTYLNVTVFEPLVKPELTGLIDPGTTYMINKMADFAYDGYHDLMKWLLPMMSQTSLRSTFNEKIEEIRGKVSE